MLYNKNLLSKFPNGTWGTFRPSVLFPHKYPFFYFYPPVKKTKLMPKLFLVYFVKQIWNI